jgi:hypothetical protein
MATWARHTPAMSSDGSSIATNHGVHRLQVVGGCHKRMLAACGRSTMADGICSGRAGQARRLRSQGARITARTVVPAIHAESARCVAGAPHLLMWRSPDRSVSPNSAQLIVEAATEARAVMGGAGSAPRTP